MKIFNVIVLLYMFISVIFGVLLIGFSLHVFELSELTFRLHELYFDYNTRIALGATGSVLILIALMFAQLISGRHEREKTIAFNNPSGQVTITLFAVEDLIRKIGAELPQIKEIKPDVVATKKRGLQVRVRLILKTNVNIPEFTSHLQEIIQHKIQDTLGVDEQINVRIHIAKIILHEKLKKHPQPSIKENENQEPSEPITMPYPHR